MKILILNYEYPPLGGGAGVITRHIAEGLARRGNDVTVLTTGYREEPEFSTALNGQLKIIRLKSKRKYTYRSNIWEMHSWMRESKHFLASHLQEYMYDITFANFALPGGDVAAFIKKRAGIPFAIISHGHDIPWFYPRQMFFYHLLLYFRIRHICMDASAIFVQSGYMMRNALRFMGGTAVKKILLIHNGADYQEFFSDGSLRSKKFRILFAGRLVKQKGPLIFLEAMKIMRDRNVTFEVKIVGDGPMRGSMETFVRKNSLDRHVVFSGWVSKETILTEYRAAHVMVAPSLNEGMSMALIEALASGLYVFTTAVSCNEKLISEGISGELFPAGDPHALAEQLSGYYQNKFLNDYRVPQATITQFHEEYDWTHIVEKYEKAFRKICES